MGSVATPTAFDRVASIHANNFYFARVWRGSHITAACALRIGTGKMPILASGGDMALGLAKFALVLGMVLAMAVIILTITTGLSPSNSRSEWTAPMALE